MSPETTPSPSLNWGCLAALAFTIVTWATIIAGAAHTITP